MPPIRPVPDPERSPQGIPIGRAPVSAMHQGMRFRAVGSRLVPRPPEEPFHTFLIRCVLVDALGAEWYREQASLPQEEQHPLVRWMITFGRAGFEPPPGSQTLESGVIAMDADGAIQSVLCVGQDLYSIEHAGGRIPEGLLSRLRDPLQFQGARYELAVGAIFARAGLRLEWIEPPTGGGRAPEFIASHDRAGLRIAVEAKSKHRRGGLGFEGGGDGTGLGVVRRILDALGQAPEEDIPFVVFVDLNLPILGDEDRLEELQDQVSRLRRTELLVPEPWSALYFTNYSWHWDEAGLIVSEAPRMVVPEWASSPLDLGTVGVILDAASQYIRVPNED